MEQLSKIDKIHKSNLKLIEEYKFYIGNKVKLKKDFKSFKKGEVFTISWVNNIYGWITFKETEQLPQEVAKILDLIDIEEFTRLKIINNLN